jgi:hypothetical protein
MIHSTMAASIASPIPTRTMTVIDRARQLHGFHTALIHITYLARGEGEKDLWGRRNPLKTLNPRKENPLVFLPNGLDFPSRRLAFPSSGLDSPSCFAKEKLTGPTEPDG